MKEFIVQLEVYAKTEINGDDRRFLDGFVERRSYVSTTSRSGVDGLMWIYAFDGARELDLDDLVQRMVEALPPVETLLDLTSIHGAVVSIGVMSDQAATSVALAPETMKAISGKLVGVGLQFMFYQTDFA